MIPQISNRVKQAYVIKIGDRYFTNFGKKGQCLTAWALAGAESFLDPQRLKLVLSKLDEKGKEYSVELITVQERSGLTLKDFYQLSYRLRRMVLKADVISPILGSGELARQISLLTAAVVVLEMDFSNKCVKKVGMNISNNLRIYSEPLAYLFASHKRTLKERLEAYKKHKEIDAFFKNGYLSEGCEVGFDMGIPF